MELLAPAGDISKLKIALKYGADAVYIGGKNYSLRANADNASLEEIKEACEYAHKLNKKVYITINIFFHEKDYDGIFEYLKYLESFQIDGIIVSDIYIIDLIHKNNIKIDIILSTQCSVLNRYGAQFYKNLGVKRIVLAREALKEDIQSIIDLGIETEVFIHGAMCTSISGKCVMSNYVTNRDSNRGGCAQICRFIFNMEDCPNNWTMMSKDLNMVKYLEEMINMHIDSFKIEGRMRSIYYIATVIKTYRTIIDKIVNKTINENYLNYAINILNRVANRESVPQFFDKFPTEKEQYFLDRNEQSNQDFLGLIKEYDSKNKIISIEVRNYFEVNTNVQIFGPNTEYDFVIKHLYDEQMNEISVARHPGEIIKIYCENIVEVDDMMRVKVFDF